MYPVVPWSPAVHVVKHAFEQDFTIVEAPTELGAPVRVRSDGAEEVRAVGDTGVRQVLRRPAAGHPGREAGRDDRVRVAAGEQRLAAGGVPGRRVTNTMALGGGRVGGVAWFAALNAAGLRFAPHRDAWIPPGPSWRRNGTWPQSFGVHREDHQARGDAGCPLWPEDLLNTGGPPEYRSSPGAARHYPD